MTKIDEYIPTTLFFIFPGCGTRSFLHQPQGKYGYGSTMDGGEGSMMFNFQFFFFPLNTKWFNDKHCNKGEFVSYFRFFARQINYHDVKRVRI